MNAPMIARIKTTISTKKRNFETRIPPPIASSKSKSTKSQITVHLLLIVTVVPGCVYSESQFRDGGDRESRGDLAGEKREALLVLRLAGLAAMLLRNPGGIIDRVGLRAVRAPIG